MPISTRSQQKEAATTSSFFPPVTKVEDLKIDDSGQSMSESISGWQRFGDAPAVEMVKVPIDDLLREINSKEITIGTPYYDEEANTCRFLIMYEPEKFYNKTTRPEFYQLQCLDELTNFNMIKNLADGKIDAAYVGLGMGQTGLMVTINLSDYLMHKFNQVFGKLQLPPSALEYPDCVM